LADQVFEAFQEVPYMIDAIRWESDLNMALSMARVQEKHVMLDFFNPG
jgi:hypothetical protein